MQRSRLLTAERGIEVTDLAEHARDVAYAPHASVHDAQPSVMVNLRVREYHTLIALNQLELRETATVTQAVEHLILSYPVADEAAYGERLTFEHA
jgi:hypothetical protein